MSFIDDYLAEVDSEQRAALQHVRAVIHKVVPDAEEVITYGMPGFKYKKKYLIAYAAFKDHMSVFPGAEAIETLTAELAEFTVSKGTVQFTLEHPLPDELIIKLVTIRQKAIDS